MRKAYKPVLVTLLSVIGISLVLKVIVKFFKKPSDDRLYSDATYYIKTATFMAILPTPDPETDAPIIIERDLFIRASVYYTLNEKDSVVTPTDIKLYDQSLDYSDYFIKKGTKIYLTNEIQTFKTNNFYIFYDAERNNYFAKASSFFLKV